MSSLLPGRVEEVKKPAKRYTNCNIQVVARTIGTKIYFKMPVANLSSTGMLLTWKEKERVPFNINTILELEVSSNGRSLQNIQCLAKVIHTGPHDEGGRRFGVKIIQADEDEYSAWHNVVSSIEDQQAVSN